MYTLFDIIYIFVFLLRMNNKETVQNRAKILLTFVHTCTCNVMH